MSRRKKVWPPIELTLDHLDARGPTGTAEDGRTWRVRSAPIGSRVRIAPGRKQSGRLLAVLDPGPHHVPSRCPIYGLCGGCQLQDTALDVQREAKQVLVSKLVGHPCEAVLAPPDVGQLQGGYHYRNKVELSWGAQQYLPEDQKDQPKEGHFLGFHPPGWFSRIVPVGACALATPAMNRVIAAVQEMALQPAWDTMAHTGTWRHLVLREGVDETLQPAVLVSLVTSSQADPDEVRAVGLALGALDGVSGVLWVVTDRLAEVSHGELREVLTGSPQLSVRVRGRHGDVGLVLAYDAFFQVNTPGAAVLFDQIAELLGVGEDRGGTLLDLYCGVGAIGMYLAFDVDALVGIELSEASIGAARDNAQRLGLVNTHWHAGPVETVLSGLDLGALPGPLRVVVDPPRAGLHPKAAAFIATLEADVLVYVACNPASLGRDREVLEAGGWRMDALCAVDLFPQTRHVEAVARFVRDRG